MPETTPRRLLLKGRYVFPVTSAPLADGFVAVEGDRIVAVGGSDEKALLAGQELCDLGNVAILPGLVNAHAHLDFSDLDSPLGYRGISLTDWIRLVCEHRRRTSVPLHQAVALGLNESLRHGVTALGDIIQPNQPPVDSPLDVTSFLELKASAADRVAGVMDLARSHARLGRAGLSPHAPYSVHPELLAAVVDLSAAQRVPVAMHLAESQEELELLRTGDGPLRILLEELGAWDGTAIARGARPMDYLRRLSAAHRALIVHGNYLDDEEIAFLGANVSRMCVVYCPRSHGWFAHVEYPLQKMLSAGATVALGTDGRCSTPDLSLLAEMRFVARRHPDVRPERILRMGTLHGAGALGREEEIGSLSPGKRADLAVVALPERNATDPHELLFDSTEPVVGCYCRGVAVIKPRPSVAPKCVRWGGSTTATPTERAHCSPSIGATDGRGFTDCWFLSGPTASGKSAVGVELARRIGAEIISLDSMALYRGMDIGTAKPTEEQRRNVPHHLIDVIEPWEEYSLAMYVEAAGRLAVETAGRGRQTLFVGGTPLYLKGLLRGIFRGPPADWQLRRRLADEAREHGAERLHRRLSEVDPASATRLHPNDTRRLIRALEVYEKTGRRISELQRQFDLGRPAEECRVFVLDWPRAELHARIDRRVDEMFAAGLVEEVRRLYSRGLLSLWERVGGPHPQPISQKERGDFLSRTARQAVGYREVIEHLEGRRGLAETVELVRRHTRRLAKRQMTWFRGLSECRFVSVIDRFDAAELAGRVALLAE